MNNTGLAKKLYRDSGLSWIDCTKLASMVNSYIKEALLDPADGVVELRGVGELYIERVRPRKARNTFKNQQIIIPERNRVRWKPSRKLAALINECEKVYDIAQTPPPTRAEQRALMAARRKK